MGSSRSGAERSAAQPSPGKGRKSGAAPACCLQVPFQGRHLFSQLGSSKPPSPLSPRPWTPKGTQVSGAPGSALRARERSCLRPRGTTDRPPSGRGGRTAALGPQTLGENFYFGGERAEVGQEPGRRVESRDALGRRAGGLAPPPPRPAAFRKSRWRCGPLPALPRKPPPADTRPRKVRGPSRAGGGARRRARSGSGEGRAREPPRRERGGRVAPPPAAGPAPRTWRASGGERGLRRGRRLREPSADPGRRGEGGASTARGRGRGPRRSRRARLGEGAQLGPCRGGGPRRTRLPGAGGGGGRAGVRGRGAGHWARGIRGAGAGARSRRPRGPSPSGWGEGARPRSGSGGRRRSDRVPGGGEGAARPGGAGGAGRS